MNPIHRPHIHREHRRMLFAGLAFLLCLDHAFTPNGNLVYSQETATPPPSRASAAIEASLDAGEFSLAFQVAQHHPRRDAPNGPLVHVVARLANHHEPRAALYTLAQIQDDRARQQALGQMVSVPLGGAAANATGGGSMADFDTLIDLITSTIEPTTWEELGGPGTIQGFAGGVFIDAAGVLQRVQPLPKNDHHAGTTVPTRDEPEPWSQLRKISLRQLETHLLRDLALRRPFTNSLKTLGIGRIQYILVYPESRDIVLAGPPLTEDPETGLRLADLAVVWHTLRTGSQQFGCSIDPRPENLVRAQRFLARTAESSIKPSQRSQWLAGLREAVGRQDINIFGIAPDTSTAQVLVEADYFLKLVGMGLARPVPRMPSYLDLVQPGPDGDLPPLEIMRWWFALTDQPVEASSDQMAFRLPERSLRVLSENELVDVLGQRQGLGTASEANQVFTASFSDQYPDLERLYPVFARMRGVFDLTIALAIIESFDLPQQVGWEPSLLTSGHWSLMESSPNARETESVVNHRVIGGRQIVAGVSGGVVIRPAAIVTRPVAEDKSAALAVLHADSLPQPRHASSDAQSATADWPRSWHWE